jgi:dTDP-3-amino-2,3,6-trideoxy-4-keto-D-glucose/dTDP-3-amino-3,4,6-trideoxy-alpha-D-glucose/dTDP-2,6-dideoxy-D-kanosamine transaminase
MLSEIMIPMNNIARTYQEHKNAIDKAINDVLISGLLVNGNANNEFCKNFSNYLKVPYVIGVASGTDALEIALKAVSLSSKSNCDEVITVANSGGYASTAIFAVGLTPVYCDIYESSHLLDFESAISCLNDRSLAIIVTHLFGGMVDINHLRQSIDKAGFAHVKIIEDCAQATGLWKSNFAAGSIGDIAAFSFYPTKNLGALGDAGSIVTGCDELAELASSLKQYGWKQKYQIAIPGGLNSRLDEIQAAVLNVFLPYLDANNQRRQSIHNTYSGVLTGSTRLVKSKFSNSAHLAVLVTHDRDAVRNHFYSKGISTEVHYPIPDHMQDGIKSRKFRIAHNGLDVTERMSTKILSIPCFSTLLNQEVAQVVNVLKTIP